MKKIIIDIPDEIYERAVKMAERLDITFDEICSTGVRRLAEDHLQADKKVKKTKPD